MKIINVNKFYYLRGGVERYFFSLADLLTSHGHEVIPFAMHHPQNLPTPYEKYFPGYVEFGTSPKDLTPALSYAEQLGGFSSTWRKSLQVKERETQRGIHVIGRMFWSFEVAKKFDQLLTATKPDLIHIHNIYHHLSPSILPVAKRHGIPVVMTVHDYKLVWPHHLLCGYSISPKDLTQTPSRPVRDSISNGARSPFVRGRRWGFSERGKKSYWNVVRERCTQGSYLKSALTVFETYFHDWLGVYKNNIDLFLAPRSFLKDMLIAAGYDERKIRVLPHFINVSAVRGQRSGVSGHGSILFFGRLSKEKGVDILLAMMHTRRPDCTLRIIGTGPEEERLKTYAARHALPVTFLGYVSDETLAQELDHALFVVIPSTFPETFGFTVIESFMHGKAVVGSRIGAVPELVEDGKTGLLVTPGDAEDLGKKVAYLLSHDRERCAMEKQARSVARQYMPERHYAALMDYYQRLL